MPRLIRLSDADPAALTGALEEVWTRDDAAVVLPPEAPEDGLPSTVRAALAGRLAPPDGTGLVVTTSGSSGAPRVLSLPRAALGAAVTASHRRLEARPGERWALALPVRHVAGLMVLLRARALGTDPVVVTDPGDPAAIAAAGAEHVALVPTQLVRILDAGVDLSGFRTILVGGGPAPDGLVERARARGFRVVTSYGMTETCGGCVYDGIPLDGTEVDVATDGRIRLRGPSVAAHELGVGPLQGDDGWHGTSDRGRLVDGHLEVLGRLDDVIISGGVNIDPVAVAGVLRTHPAVADAVVLGVPDPTWGQRVRAVVVLSGGADGTGLRALRAHVADRLGPSHAPRDLVAVDAIPRDGMGKVSADVRLRFVELPTTSAIDAAT